MTLCGGSGYKFARHMTNSDSLFDPVQVASEVLDLEIKGLDRLRSQFADPGSELSAALNRCGRNLPRCQSGQVIVTGMGKIGSHRAQNRIDTGLDRYASQCSSIPAKPAMAILGMISRDDVILALSNSGETAELGDMIAYAGRFAISSDRHDIRGKSLPWQRPRIFCCYCPNRTKPAQSRGRRQRQRHKCWP